MFRKKPTCQETQSLQWAKTRNRAWKSHSKIWKMYENAVLNTISSFCSKDLKKKSLKSPWCPSRVSASTPVQTICPPHPWHDNATTRNHSGRQNEWSQAAVPWVFFFQVNFLFGINLRGMLLLCVLCGLDHQRFFVLGIWWASQLVVETIIGKPWFEVEITHYATQTQAVFPQNWTKAPRNSCNNMKL